MSVKFRVIVEALVLLILVAVFIRHFEEPFNSFINTFGETRLSSDTSEGDEQPYSERQNRCGPSGVCGSGCNVAPGEALPPGCPSGDNAQQGSGETAVDPDVGREEFFVTPRQLNILIYFGIVAGSIALIVILLAVRPTIAKHTSISSLLNLSVVFMVVLSSVLLSLIKVFDAKDMMTIFSGVIGFTAGRYAWRKYEPPPSACQKKAVDVTSTAEPEGPAPVISEPEEPPPEPTKTTPPAAAPEPTCKHKKIKKGKKKVINIFVD